MRIQTNKTKLWRLARDYGAQPPGLQHTELICYESGSYGLVWPDGPKVYLTASLGRPFLQIGKDFHRMTVDELRRRGMVSGGSPRAVVRQVDGMGRITLPPKLREQFGLEHGSRVELVRYRDGVFVRPCREEV